MKLSKRTDSFTPKYKKEEPVEYKKAPPLDWNKFEVDWDKEIPYGKFQGKTLQYVKHTDDWYWSWINDNDIINQWALYKPKWKPHSAGINCFFAESFGEYWIGIREIEEHTDPSPWI